jgi:glycosyltransferase involved in cell wall biosynthesis
VRRFDRQQVPPDILVQKRAELGIPQDSPVIGFVGRLVAEKGILELLAAAPAILQRYPQVRFLFIGEVDSEKPDALTPQIAHQYDVAHACVFAGRREDMPELFALIDAFVLPSHRESFPRSPMEAASMQVPCVLTDIPGCREVVEHGRNGLLIPLEDVSALSEAVLQILGDKPMAARMGQEGRKMALARFDERLVFEKVKAEYARLLTEKGLPVPPGSINSIS